MAKAAQKPAKGKKERKPRKQKPVITAEMGETNDEGKFSSLPTLGEGQTFAQFAPLKKDAFADEATYLEYRAATTEERITKMQKQVQDLRDQADLSRRYGNSEMRKKAKALHKKRQAIAQLEAELKELGLDVDDL